MASDISSSESPARAVMAYLGRIPETDTQTANTLVGILQTFGSWKVSDLDNDPDLCSAAFHAAMVHPAFTPDMRKTIGDTLDVVLSNFQTEVGEKGAVLKHDQAYPASAVPIRIESDPRKKGNYVFVLQVWWSDGEEEIALRSHHDLFQFQCKLLDLFPNDGGTTNRVLPYLPGKKMLALSSAKQIAEARLPGIMEYMSALFACPDRISKCDHVRNFFLSCSQCGCEAAQCSQGSCPFQSGHASPLSSPLQQRRRTTAAGSRARSPRLSDVEERVPVHEEEPVSEKALQPSEIQSYEGYPQGYPVNAAGFEQYDPYMLQPVMYMVPGPGQAPVGYVAVSPPHGAVQQSYGAPYPVHYGYTQQPYDDMRRSDSYSGAFQQGGKQGGSRDEKGGWEDKGGRGRADSTSSNSSSHSKSSRRKKNKSGSNTSINTDKGSTEPPHTKTLSSHDSTQSLPDITRAEEKSKRETVSWAKMNAHDDEEATQSDALGSQSSLPSSTMAPSPRVGRSARDSVTSDGDHRTPPPSPHGASESSLVPESLNSKRVYECKLCRVPDVKTPCCMSCTPLLTPAEMMDILKETTTHDFSELADRPDELALAVRQVTWLKLCRLHKYIGLLVGKPRKWLHDTPAAELNALGMASGATKKLKAILESECEIPWPAD